MSAQHLTVWYNTRCPVCDAGIDWQRNKLLAVVRAGSVEFKDINEQPDALARYGATLDDIRRRLHATDEAGRHHHRGRHAASMSFHHDAFRCRINFWTRQLDVSAT